MTDDDLMGWERTRGIEQLPKDTFPVFAVVVEVRNARQPFKVGEILALDEVYGREIWGEDHERRKPSKWDVTVEVCANEASARAVCISEGITPLVPRQYERFLDSSVRELARLLDHAHGRA